MGGVLAAMGEDMPGRAEDVSGDEAAGASVERNASVRCQSR
jgi:hypothetical protein